MSEPQDSISELQDKAREGQDEAVDGPDAGAPDAGGGQSSGGLDVGSGRSSGGLDVGGGRSSGAPDASGDHDHVDRVMAQWGRVAPDLDTAPLAVIARLGRTAAYVDAGINGRLAEFGLSRAAWDVLASLRRTGPPHRLSPTQLYIGLMRSSGAMTHRLYGLERAGLVKRVPDPDDARGMLVQLTSKGVALVDRVAPLHLDNERALIGSLTEDEQRMLADLLRKLLVAFEREHPTPPPSGRGGRRKARARRRA